MGPLFGSTIHGIQAVRKLSGVVPLDPDGLCQRAAWVVAGAQAGKYVGEVVAWAPAEVAAGTGVVIYPLDARQHAPAAACVLALVPRHAAHDHRRRVVAQFHQVVSSERRGCAEQVAPEADVGRAVDGKQMGVTRSCTSARR